MVKVKIEGLKQLRAAMMELPRRVDVKLLNAGLIKGANVVRDEAKARVPLLKVPDPRRVRGAIRKAIRSGRVRPEGYAAKVWVRVRPLTKAQISKFKKKSGVAAANNPNDPYFWRFVEFGTSKMAARPFMREAFKSRSREAVDTAVKVFRERIQAEIEKLGRRGIFR